MINFIFNIIGFAGTFTILSWIIGLLVTSLFWTVIWLIPSFLFSAWLGNHVEPFE